MDIFTIKQWLFLLIISNSVWWLYFIHLLSQHFKTLKQDHETIYKELKKATRDI